MTGNHESDGRDGQIEKFVQCLPNKLPGLEGEYGVQWRVDVPEQNPVVRFIMVSPGIDFRGGAAGLLTGQRPVALDADCHRRGQIAAHSVDRGGNACAVPECRQV